jgi:hypothetical protein
VIATQRSAREIGFSKNGKLPIFCRLVPCLSTKTEIIRKAGKQELANPSFPAFLHS